MEEGKIHHDAVVKGEGERTTKILAWDSKLPIFQDGKDDLDAYLGCFEQFAMAQNWAKEHWATSLSALLTGKALETYFRLPADQVDDFDSLKEALLRRYQLTEEEFRCKFFTSLAESGETVHQFMAHLEGYFDRWVKPSQSQETFAELRDLVTREQSIDSCHKDLATFFRERKLRIIKDVVDKADHYQQAHSGNLSVIGKSRGGSSQNKSEETRTCHKCGKVGHIAPECQNTYSAKQNRGMLGQSVSTEESPSHTEMRSCHKCGRKVRIAPNCQNGQYKETE